MDTPLYMFQAQQWRQLSGSILPNSVTAEVDVPQGSAQCQLAPTVPCPLPLPLPTKA